MIVLVYEPNAIVGELREISGDLESLQKIVGGYIECVQLGRTALTMIVNEEGSLENLPANKRVPFAVGTVFCVRVGGSEYVSLTDEDIDALRGVFDQ